MLTRSYREFGAKRPEGRKPLRKCDNEIDAKYKKSGVDRTKEGRSAGLTRLVSWLFVRAKLGIRAPKAANSPSESFSPEAEMEWRSLHLNCL